jgi:hypothetical protein
MGEIGTGPLFGFGRGKARISAMWSWFVFVISSVSWLHMGYERVRCSRMIQAYPTRALER